MKLMLYLLLAHIFSKHKITVTAKITNIAVPHEICALAYGLLKDDSNPFFWLRYYRTLYFSHFSTMTINGYKHILCCRRLFPYFLHVWLQHFALYRYSTLNSGVNSFDCIDISKDLKSVHSNL